MAQVVVQIIGRNYTMQCDDGQEEHLRGLAAMINEEVDNIVASVGQLGDLRLLIMAALVLADKYSESEKARAELERQLADLRATRSLAEKQALAMDNAAARTLEAAAQRLETLATTASTYLAPAADTEEDGDGPKSGTAAS